MRVREFAEVPRIAQGARGHGHARAAQAHREPHARTRRRRTVFPARCAGPAHVPGAAIARMACWNAGSSSETHGGYMALVMMPVELMIRLASLSAAAVHSTQVTLESSGGFLRREECRARSTLVLACPSPSRHHTIGEGAGAVHAGPSHSRGDTRVVASVIGHGHGDRVPRQCVAVRRRDRRERAAFLGGRPGGFGPPSQHPSFGFLVPTPVDDPGGRGAGVAGAVRPGVSGRLGRPGEDAWCCASGRVAGSLGSGLVGVIPQLHLLGSFGLRGHAKHDIPRCLRPVPLPNKPRPLSPSGSDGFL